MAEELLPTKGTREIPWKNKYWTDPEFKKVIIKMLTELRKIINRNADHCNKELESIKINQSRTENSIAEIKSNLEAMNSQLNDPKKCSSVLENRIMEITQLEQQKDKWKKKSNTQDLWDNIKHATYT